MDGDHRAARYAGFTHRSPVRLCWCSCPPQRWRCSPRCAKRYCRRNAQSLCPRRGATRKHNSAKSAARTTITGRKIFIAGEPSLSSFLREKSRRAALSVFLLTVSDRVIARPVDVFLNHTKARAPGQAGGGNKSGPGGHSLDFVRDCGTITRSNKARDALRRLPFGKEPFKIS